uniref:Uncharacterized protein n=1 Tax=Chrysemys picta bellii TaxID=8478 RepID=A0A8C3FB89_CHRPI
AGKLDLSMLITGAANGIGRQIALNFARLGATLTLCSILNAQLPPRPNSPFLGYSSRCVLAKGHKKVIHMLRGVFYYNDSMLGMN